MYIIYLFLDKKITHKSERVRKKQSEATKSNHKMKLNTNNLTPLFFINLTSAGAKGLILIRINELTCAWMLSDLSMHSTISSQNKNRCGDQPSKFHSQTEREREIGREAVPEKLKQLTSLPW